MNGFSLPAAQAANQVATRAVFQDAEGASRWLAAQPQANVPAMLAGLQDQIEALNRHDLSPRERFKTLEVLRKAVFAVGNDCRRRCEGKPLPLAAAERAALDAGRRLWRGYAAGYQHCLQSCLDGDSSLSRYSARVAHRVSACLRMEQLTGYAGGAAPGPGFWKGFHALFLSAERLGCAGEPVEDRLLGETRASSVSGQYAMALMLHLARPFSLSGGQLAAAVRWLARWRERVRIVGRPDMEAKSRPLLLDLAEDRPLHEGGREACLSRWLVLDSVLGKIRGRREALAAGASPESLKLGDRLPAESCMALLEMLTDRLRHPPRALPADLDGMPELAVGAGLDIIRGLLGGGELKEALQAPATDDHLASEQLAVFGHVVREAPPRAEAGLERWRLARRERKELVLLRSPGNGTSRLSLRGLLAIRRQEGCLLAVITGLRQCEDGALCCTAAPLSGDAAPRGVEVRDRITGKVERHPALLLAAGGDRARPDLLMMPAGVMARASGARFLDGHGQPLPGLRLADCLERGGEVDFWRLASDG